MAVAANPLTEEEIDPSHPQYQHGMEAGLTAAGALANLPRVPPDQPISSLATAAKALPGLDRRTVTDNPINPGGSISTLPRTIGQTPAVGGTQAVLPMPKPENPPGLPRKRNQSAVTFNPTDFFRRK